MLKLAVLVSGTGRSLSNLAEAIERDGIAAEIVEVISSNPDAYGLVRAAKRGIGTTTIEPGGRPPSDRFSKQIFERVRDRGVDLVCLAGFLWKLAIPEDFRLRVLNIHPALLPAFGGKGMYGHHVHEAVIAAGCKVSGCTVHLADNDYDQGPILVQRCCPVLDSDGPDALADRVFAQECIAYPEAVNLIAQGRVVVSEGRVILGEP